MAVQKLTDQALLAEISKTDDKEREDVYVILAACDRLTDQTMLVDVAENAKYGTARARVCERTNHKWDGCVCSRCGKKRNEHHEQHDWNGCVCSRCGNKRN